MSAPPFLPYGRQEISDADIAAVVDVLRGPMLTTGPTIARFEAEMADVVGAAHAIACSSGTAGLHLAAMALDLAPGDAVIVPSVTFLATASAPALCGAEIAFTDVDPSTGVMTIDGLRAALDHCAAQGWRPRAVFPVHLNGATLDLAPIAAEARMRGLAIVEDACHALGGATVAADGRRTGVGDCAYADVVMFSLHPVKAIAAGEGGVLTTNDAALAARIRRDLNHGMSRDAENFDPSDGFAADGDANPWYYELLAPSTNYRLSDIHAALALSQLGRLPGFVAKRAALVAHYRARLPADGAVVATPAPACVADGGAWHLMTVAVDFEQIGRDRAALMAALRARGVGTQVHYRPLHRHTYWRRRYGDASLPGADAYYDARLSLPLFTAMSTADVDRVVDVLLEETRPR